MSRSSIVSRLLVGSVALLIACSGGPSAGDAGTSDAGTGDAGARDAGAPGDAGTDGGSCAADCGHGHCILAAGAESCVCDPGFHAEGLYCRRDPCTGAACPMSVDEWRRRFDLEYEHPRRIEEDCTSRSLSGGTVDQDYYFLAYCIDGLVSAWRATGDDTYLDEALRLIGNTVDSSVPDALGRRHWAGTYALWDSYYWRMVTSLLRVMQAHPELLARADYQARYDDLLAFSVGLWGYWRDDGLGNFYRSRTHMASHWARIGMDLYLITGDAEYREVFDNISHGVQVGQPSNLRTQFQPNLAHPTAYVWASVWGAELDASVQDTSHAGALVAFIHEAALAGMYWTQADIDALANTLMLVVWDPALDGGYHQYVDGTDPAEGPYGLPNTTGGRLHEWLNLGRHRADIQARIETEYLDQTRRNTSFYAYQLYGIGALNARVLADGRPYY